MAYFPHCITLVALGSGSVSLLCLSFSLLRSTNLDFFWRLFYILTLAVSLAASFQFSLLPSFTFYIYRISCCELQRTCKHVSKFNIDTFFNFFSSLDLYLFHTLQSVGAPCSKSGYFGSRIAIYCQVACKIICRLKYTHMVALQNEIKIKKGGSWYMEKKIPS